MPMLGPCLIRAIFFMILATVLQVYNEGRLVKNVDGDIGLKPSSKKLG
jgi:hypothetical protein